MAIERHMAVFDDGTYDATVLPLYGAPRDAEADEALLTTNGGQLPHAYAVAEREDLTMHETYCIATRSASSRSARR